MNDSINLPEFESCKIAVIGMGYVGLPLAVCLAKQKKCAATNRKLFRTIIGFDISSRRIKELNNGIDITKEVEPTDIIKSDSIKFSSEEKDIYNSDVFIITVPTPIDEFNNPNLDSLISASQLVGRALGKRDNSTCPIIIYESTVYPGATEEICIPEIESCSKKKINIDFFCGYSPERVNPGDKKRKLNDVVKVTSGSNKISAIWIDKFYSSIINAGTCKASSIKVAEAAKVIENTQRDLNIALINELSMIFFELNLDTNEIIDVASTKWNFQNFRPGLVGGHCIGVDPYYLTHKAKSVGFYPQLVLAGRRINENMSKWIVNKIILKLVSKGLNISNAKTLILGFTFKENCPDIRNTKIIDIIKIFNQYNINPTVVDPLADREESKRIYGLDISNNIPDKKFEIIILAVGHDNFRKIKYQDWINLKKENGEIIDLKNIIPKEVKALRF